MGNGTLGLFVQLTYMVSAADLAPHLHKVQPFAWYQVPVMTVPPPKDGLCYCPLVSHTLQKWSYFARVRYVNLLLPGFPVYSLLSEPGRCSQDLIYLGGAFGWASHCGTCVCKNLNTTCGVLFFISFADIPGIVFGRGCCRKDFRVGRPSVGKGISCCDKSGQRDFNAMLIFSALNQQLSLLLKLV